MGSSELLCVVRQRLATWRWIGWGERVPRWAVVSSFGRVSDTLVITGGAGRREELREACAQE